MTLTLAALVLLAACEDDLPTPGGSESGGPTVAVPRLDVYETLVRHLADPSEGEPIYLVSDLCFDLMRGERTCPDRLTEEEERELEVRLQDLGDIAFVSDDDPGPSPEGRFQEILFGPIVERPDSLRVEGGTVCGGTCGHGAVYILVLTEDGYEVTGTDDTYGEWIA